MKPILRFSFIVLIAVATFASCRHSTGRSTSATFFSASSATMGSFSASGTSLYAGGAAGAKIAIQATSSTGAMFELWIDHYPGTTGVYTFNDSTIGAQYTSPAVDTLISAVHGTLTLTAVSPDIIGSFSYTGRDSSIVTGSFDVVLVP